MIAIPAVDLRAGACVQLVGGSYADERVRLHDPVAVAGHWTALGFRRLHVVDLDAATGRGDNGALVDEIVAMSSAEVQVGGGVRTSERVDDLIAAGARHIIVGTGAIENPAWLNELAAGHPGQLIVAADVRGRQLVTRGWDDMQPTDVETFVSNLSPLPLGGILVTAVHKEGRMEGPDLDLIEDVIRGARHPVIASGGIRNAADLRALAERGVAAAVIGMALYVGALDARAVAEEFDR